MSVETRRFVSSMIQHRFMMSSTPGTRARDPEDQRSAPGGMPGLDGPVDTVYRRFFLASIVLTITTGAGWGVWLLWRIGSAQSFTGVSVNAINAHGQAQIYGWVGMFIMGFAYQGFPRLWQSRAAGRGVANTVFGLMIAGVVARTVGMAYIPGDWGSNIALVGGVMQMVAIVLFSAQIVGIQRSGKAPFSAPVAFVLAALVFFILQCALDLWHTHMTMTAESHDQRIWYISTYQGPLRDLQIHGLALFMILGVSLHVLPRMFGVARVSDRRVWWGLGLLCAAVVGEVGLFIAYRHTDNHALAGLLMVPWVMLIVGCWMIVGPWRPWRAMPLTNRAGKFVRCAYAWLGVALLMLLLLPLYLVVSKIPFSHAYYGAIRHAITVGFISMMILGISSLVVPRINGVDPQTLSALWGPFVLINLGCLMRVGFQTLTDWHPIFYALVGISGIFELAALTWWGWHLTRLMWTQASLQKA